jgi:hypothetical protein
MSTNYKATLTSVLLYTPLHAVKDYSFCFDHTTQTYMHNHEKSYYAPRSYGQTTKKLRTRKHYSRLLQICSYFLLAATLVSDTGRLLGFLGFNCGHNLFFLFFQQVTVKKWVLIILFVMVVVFFVIVGGIFLNIQITIGMVRPINLPLRH